MDKIALYHLQKSMSRTEDTIQFTYKENLRTTDCLLSAIDFILSKLDENAGTALKGLFVGYSSAFNTMLQNKLQKINSNNPNAAKWLTSYMNNWRQKVKAQTGKSSSEINVIVGIPQGGPFSAKLFTYDTDDITNISINIDENRGIIFKYSDDTIILHHISKSTPDKCNKDYESACNRLYL